jgi:hypothetical protein
MDRNLPNNPNRLPKSGVQVDRIARIITEQWPEIWKTTIDRQQRLIEQRNRLLLAAVRQQ